LYLSKILSTFLHFYLSTGIQVKYILTLHDTMY